MWNEDECRITLEADYRKKPSQEGLDKLTTICYWCWVKENSSLLKVESGFIIFKKANVN